MNKLLLLTCCLTPLFSYGASFQEDPAYKNEYKVSYDWLKSMPTPLLATNIRGEGLVNAGRRMAALDLVEERRDRTVLPELLTALDQKSFLTSRIIEVLGRWKDVTVVPPLSKMLADPTQPLDVRLKLIETLLILNDDRAAVGLLNVATNPESESSLRKSAFKALGTLGTDASRAALQNWISKPDAKGKALVPDAQSALNEINRRIAS